MEDHHTSKIKPRQHRLSASALPAKTSPLNTEHGSESRTHFETLEDGKVSTKASSSKESVATGAEEKTADTSAKKPRRSSASDSEANSRLARRRKSSTQYKGRAIKVTAPQEAFPGASMDPKDGPADHGQVPRSACTVLVGGSASQPKAALPINSGSEGATDQNQAYEDKLAPTSLVAEKRDTISPASPETVALCEVPAAAKPDPGLGSPVALVSDGDGWQPKSPSGLSSGMILLARILRSPITNASAEKKSFRRAVFVISFGIGVVLIATVAATLLLLTWGQSTQRRGDLCVTGDCQLHAALLANALAHNIDACEDFYAHVCSKWSPSGERRQLRDFDSEIEVYTPSIASARWMQSLQDVTKLDPSLKNQDKVVFTLRISEDDQKQINRGFDRMRRNAIRLAKAAVWLDSESKDSVVAKLEALKLAVWPPSTFLSNESLEEIYQRYPEREKTFGNYWINEEGKYGLFPEIPALQVAYSAFLDTTKEGERDPPISYNFTQTQVFFLTLCYMTCSQKGVINPFSANCNKVARNSVGFANAFGCPPGSKMNPVQKCTFFG
ncbi:hypothetical protein HPB49_008582 [Dermacentor silvarum]|uniref:Uncharacterized protein n=1 Tax=Dermacentor silvarum TaxID=543639 RepID=A0ACB8C8E4_DERSI|nr:hypothetical protein HPB49_008582 [Dermacentor silvarum]